jgi:NAD(P)-dependent dehydrogenase (short-subunit alcohol dehydrogenase family)
MKIKKGNMQKKAIIISVSSDIGTAICDRWVSEGLNVAGTYRTRTESVDLIHAIGVELVYCDLKEKESIVTACKILTSDYKKWDILVLCPGSQDPVGRFMGTDFDEWELSVKVNFLSQLRIVYELLPARNTESKYGPSVLFFAGGGTNNATVNYSAYTISKIALIKMTELLDAEIQDTRFSIIGPGWVKTKIHDSTLKAGTMAGDNFEKTKNKLASDEFTSMDDVLNSCDWIVNSPKEVVSGRNFSTVFDLWGTKELTQKLLNDFNMYKLRRYGNDIMIKGEV